MKYQESGKVYSYGTALLPQGGLIETIIFRAFKIKKNTYKNMKKSIHVVEIERKLNIISLKKLNKCKVKMLFITGRFGM